MTSQGLCLIYINNIKEIIPHIRLNCEWYCVPSVPDLSGIRGSRAGLSMQQEYLSAPALWRAPTALALTSLKHTHSARCTEKTKAESVQTQKSPKGLTLHTRDRGKKHKAPNKRSRFNPHFPRSGEVRSSTFNTSWCLEGGEDVRCSRAASQCVIGSHIHMKLALVSVCARVLSPWLGRKRSESLALRSARASQLRVNGGGGVARQPRAGLNHLTEKQRGKRKPLSRELAHRSAARFPPQTLVFLEIQDQLKIKTKNKKTIN